MYMILPRVLLGNGKVSNYSIEDVLGEWKYGLGRKSWEWDFSPNTYNIAIHIHSRDTEEAIFSRREADLATAVFGAVQLDVSNPSFRQASPNIGAHVFIVGGSRSVFSVELFF
jgi:hypothetical protein